MRRATLLFCVLLIPAWAGVAVGTPVTMADARTDLASAQPDVRAHAITYLAKQGEPGARLLASHLATETVTTLQVVVLDVLGKSAVSDIVPQVTAMLSHAEPRVRGAALLSLASLSAGDGRRAALHVLHHPRTGDPEWSERATALLALAQVAPKTDFASIEKAYKGGGGEQRWLARACFAEVIASLAPDAPARLTALLIDDDTRVGVSAAAMLYDVAGANALTAHLTHPAPRVRIAVIGGLHKRAAKATAKRLQSVARFDKNRGVRWSAALTLWHFSDKAADDLVLEGVRAKDAAIWMTSVDLLRRRLGVDHEQDVDKWRKALDAWRSTQR